MEGGNTPKISQVSTPNIIWVNGSFDVVHAGHIELFKYARSVGDYLVVGTDTDKRIRELKGPTRPINKQIHRLSMLNAIKYIGLVATRAFACRAFCAVRKQKRGARSRMRRRLVCKCRTENVGCAIGCAILCSARPSATTPVRPKLSGF